MEPLFAIPQMVRAWPDFGQKAGLSRQATYAYVEKMPEDLKIRLGRRVRLNAAKLAAWLEAGGDRVCPA